MEAMKVTVKIIGPFVYEAGFSEKELEFQKPVKAGELPAYVNIPESRAKIITRNGRAVSPQEELKDGDRIVICPIYSGG